MHLDSNRKEIYQKSINYRLCLNILAGGFSGLVTDFLCYPLETLKTRQQVSKKMRIKSKPTNLFHGVSIQMLGSFPMTATYFTTYEGIKFGFDSVFLGEYKVSMYFKSFVGAMFAEITGCFVANPFELIKQNIQVGNQSSIRRFFITVIKKAGWRGLYRGYNSLLGREIPFSCLQMPIYEVGQR